MPWTTVRVDRDVNERLKELAQKEGVSVREFLRRVVEGMAEEQEKPRSKRSIVEDTAKALDEFGKKPLSPEEWELSEVYWTIKKGYERWLEELEKVRKLREEAEKNGAHPTTIARLDGLIAMLEDQQRKITSVDDYVIMLADFLTRRMNAPHAADRLVKLWEATKEWRARLL